jgi:anti-anti-sigma factor
MTVVLGPCSDRLCTVYIDGPLLAPLKPELLTRVRALLRRGERRIVLEMSRVSLIDAEGVGELVRAYNIASAMGASCRIVHTTRWVRETFARVGLFELLSADGDAECSIV